jgi:thiol-disulfide isomerase/thioredoxin
MNSPAYYLIARRFTSIAIFILCFFPLSAFAADINFEDDKGQIISTQNFKGKPLIINFWATWCTPCVEEMPALAALQEAYKSKGLLVLAVSEDDSAGTAKDFYAKNHIPNLPVYFDASHKAWQHTHVNGIPTSLIIDKKGNILQTLEGVVDWNSQKTKGLLDKLI